MITTMKCFYLTGSSETTEKGVFASIGVMQDGSVENMAVPIVVYNVVSRCAPMTEIELGVKLTNFKGQKGYRVVSADIVKKVK